jgi:K(+)-stimulated pyrophosphate-energized sodium pump
MSLLTPVQHGWAQGAAPPSSQTRMGLAQQATGIELAGVDYAVVGAVMVIALAALAFGYVLIKEVLAAGQGTAKMQDIAKGVQEGASAYLNRQFRTLAIFAVVVFLVLFALPAETLGERIGRSVFFLFGAAFSAAIGSPRERARGRRGPRAR